MNLRIIRKVFLISLFIFPQFFASIKSSQDYESQSKKISDVFLISGWKISSDEIFKGKKANE